MEGNDANIVNVLEFDSFDMKNLSFKLDWDIFITVDLQSWSFFFRFSSFLTEIQYILWCLAMLSDLMNMAIFSLKRPRVHQKQT